MLVGIPFSLSKEGFISNSATKIAEKISLIELRQEVGASHNRPPLKEDSLPLQRFKMSDMLFYFSEDEIPAEQCPLLLLLE